MFGQWERGNSAIGHHDADLYHHTRDKERSSLSSSLPPSLSFSLCLYYGVQNPLILSFFSADTTAKNVIELMRKFAESSNKRLSNLATVFLQDCCSDSLGSVGVAEAGGASRETTTQMMLNLESESSQISAKHV